MRFSRGTLLLTILLVPPQIRVRNLALNVERKFTETFEVDHFFMTSQTSYSAQHFPFEKLVDEAVLFFLQIGSPAVVLMKGLFP